jgi:hypothetical protein
MVKPKAYRLNVAVPRIRGGVAVAIVASTFHNRSDMFGNLVVCGKVKIGGSRFIFFHGNKLDGYQDDDYGEGDFLDHVFFGFFLGLYLVQKV